MNIQISSSVYELDKLTPQGKLKVRVHPGERFEIVDSETGRVPANLVARRWGSSLFIDVDTAGTEIELVDFFATHVAADPATVVMANPAPQVLAAAGDESAAASLTQAEAANLIETTTIASSGNTLQAITGNQIGTLEVGQAIGFGDAGGLTIATSNDLISTASVSLGSLGAVGAGLATAGSSSTAVAAAIAAPAAVSGAQIAGVVMAGPVQAGLSVTLYDNAGHVLATTTTDAQGKYQLTVTNGYTGAVLVVVRDANGSNADYRDEATGKDVSMDSAELRASGFISSRGELTLTVTPVTELAVRAMGIAPGDTKASASADLIQATNASVAKVLGLSGVAIDSQAPIATNGGQYNAADGLSAGERYGAVLAALSGVDASAGGLAAGLNTLSIGAGMTISGSALGLTTAGVNALMAGAHAADDKVAGELTVDIAKSLSRLPIVATPVALVAAPVLDKTAPTLKITSDFAPSAAHAALGKNEVTHLTFNFSEAVKGFTQSDISVVGGALSHFVVNADTNAYATAVFTPKADSTALASVGVAAGSFSDKAGNASAQAATFNLHVDTTHTYPAPSPTGAHQVSISEHNISNLVKNFDADYIASAPANAQGRIAYSLSGADAAQFQVDANGKVTFKNLPDYEKPTDAGRDNIYNLTVTSADTAAHKLEQKVEIRVTNVFEPSTDAIDLGGISLPGLTGVSLALVNPVDVTSTDAKGVKHTERYYYLDVTASDDARVNASTDSLTLSALKIIFNTPDNNAAHTLSREVQVFAGGPASKLVLPGIDELNALGNLQNTVKWTQDSPASQQPARPVKPLATPASWGTDSSLWSSSPLVNDPHNHHPQLDNLYSQAHLGSATPNTFGSESSMAHVLVHVV